MRIHSSDFVGTSVRRRESRNLVANLSPRQYSEGKTNGMRALIALAIIALIILSTFLAAWVWTRLAARRNRQPDYLPADGMKAKSQNIWSRMRGRGDGDRGTYSSHLQPPSATSPSLNRDRSHVPDIERELADMTMRHTEDTSYRGVSNAEAEGNGDLGITSTTEATTETRSGGTNGGVDRNTSIRSIMTLPPYSPSARPTEQILGREGERAGIDIVLEHPETVDEEETRRDEEMESLYRIRRARRQEAAEREERRQQRRDARARGDTVTLARLQAESRARAERALLEEEATLSNQLIAEHQARTASRERRVSSVTYGGLGVARHDGSRIRANSTDSDNRPLLDSAASISGMSIYPPTLGGDSRPQSIRTLNTLPSPNPPFGHHRGRSASSQSVLSVSTAADNESRVSEEFEPISLSAARSHSRSPSNSISIVTTPGITPPEDLNLDHSSDVGDMPIPAVDPPNYEGGGWEEAPPYESPTSETRRVAEEDWPVAARGNREGERPERAADVPRLGDLPFERERVESVPDIRIERAMSPVSPVSPVEMRR